MESRDILLQINKPFHFNSSFQLKSFSPRFLITGWHILHFIGAFFPLNFVEVSRNAVGYKNSRLEARVPTVFFFLGQESKTNIMQ